jgi:hypothetical protein
MSTESLAKARMRRINGEPEEEPREPGSDRLRSVMRIT